VGCSVEVGHTLPELFDPGLRLLVHLIWFIDLAGNGTKLAAVPTTALVFFSGPCYCALHGYTRVSLQGPEMGIFSPDERFVPLMYLIRTLCSMSTAHVLFSRSNPVRNVTEHKRRYPTHLQ
jgi:hypothetical protein